MKCRICGNEMVGLDTDLPFKLSEHSIIIIKNLPVLQCHNCSEYLIEDEVMAKVDLIMDKIDRTAELEILSYAA